MGLVLWEIATRQEPYDTPAQRALAIWDFRAAVCDGMRPATPPTGTDPEYVALIQACWQGPPEERPTATAAMTQLDVLRERFGVPEVRQRRHADVMEDSTSTMTDSVS